MKRIAICPGSFDPITNGHIDVIKRTAKLFDEVIVAPLNNPSKKPLFSLEEKIELILHCTSDIPNVKVESFSGLLTDFFAFKQATVVVKGLRAVSDYENELQMAVGNRHLNDKLETLFMPTSTEFSYLSSSMVKEVASLGKTVESWVHPIVSEALEKKYRKQG